jgi:hypothetical protein
MLCRGCGFISPDAICSKCKAASEHWHECETCKQSCPTNMKYCVPCKVDFKRNRKCSSCGKPSPDRLCAECYKQSPRQCAKCKAPCKLRFCDDCYNTPEQCVGCGGKKRPGRTCCMKCSEYPWAPCIACTNLTPLRDVCFNCRQTRCKKCLQPSNTPLCIECNRVRRKGCLGCGQKILPRYSFCTECEKRVGAAEYAEAEQE